MKIRIIITGGTFDKHYDELKGDLTFKDSHLPEILQYTRCTVPIELEINQLIDSLHIQQPNRYHILNSCKEAPEENIVITHGTDRMVETARFLGEADLDKTIVLTGSLRPYIMSNSDAVFNLGCSITACQLLPKGVYVVMNGRIFDADNVCKNQNTGVFEEMPSEAVTT